MAAACFAAAIYSFAVWGPHWKKRMTAAHTWGPWILILGGPILGLIWLYFAPEPRAAELAPKAETAVAQPASSTMGFFASAFARLYDTPELRRKYLFDFLAPTNSRFAFYVSPSDLFIFSVWDVNGEQYTLEVPIAADTIPLSSHIFLYCELALYDRSTGLRILVNGKKVAERTLNFKLELGKEYWKWKQATFGADVSGQNNAPFKVAMTTSGHTPLTDTEVALFEKRFEDYLVAIDSPIQRR